MTRLDKICLADHGKHRWKYLGDQMLRRRECQKCGVMQQRQVDGRWTSTVRGDS